MGIRRQFVLDHKTERLLRDLTADGNGNASRIVREAIRQYAEREGMFEAVESDPGFIAMMERSEADFRAGRFVTHEEVKRKIRATRKRRRK